MVCIAGNLSSCICFGMRWTKVCRVAHGMMWMKRLRNGLACRSLAISVELTW